MPASITFIEDKLTRRQQGLGWQMPLHHDMHPRINRRNKSMEVSRWCLVWPRPWSQDNIPMSLKMKLLCKYQWGSFLDNQDNWCWAPNSGSSVYHVSVPGSVADTHNSDKIDIKNHTFIANGESTLHGLGLQSLGHWPYIVYQSSKTAVLCHRGSISYRQLGVRM